MKKEIMVIKDCRFLGLYNSLEIQWSKRLVDENNKILDKENVRSTIDLECAKIEGSNAKETLEKFIPTLVIAQAEEIGNLQSQINAISKECAEKVSVSKKAIKDKEDLEGELLITKDKLNKHENNLPVIKAIYDENQKLKEELKRSVELIDKLEQKIQTLKSETTLIKKAANG